MLSLMENADETDFEQDSMLADFTEEQRVQYSRFQKLISEAKALLAEAESGTMCLDKLKDLADKGLEILILVENLELAMLDMRLMEILFQIFQHNIRTINPERLRFNKSEFSRRILRFVDVAIGEEQEEDKDATLKLKKKLIDYCHPQICYQAPLFNIGTGGLEVVEPENMVQKVPKQREKKTKDKIEPVTKPETLQCTVGRTLEETVVEVANILEATYIENGRKPINYLKFILHPTDFALTVENIFHISFLINNNKVNVFVDEKSGMPMLKPIEGGGEEEVTREGKAAMIIQMSQEEWEQAVDLLNITEPMIKVGRVVARRPEPQPSTSGTRKSKKR